MTQFNKYFYIVSVVTIISISVYAYSLYTNLKNVKIQNETLQEAIAHPAVIIKERIIYRQTPPTIITKYIREEKINGDVIISSITENTLGDSVAIITDGGSETIPVVPKIEVVKTVEQKLVLYGQFGINKDLGVGVGYSLFKPLSLGLGYNDITKLNLFVLWRF